MNCLKVMFQYHPGMLQTMSLARDKYSEARSSVGGRCSVASCPCWKWLICWCMPCSGHWQSWCQGRGSGISILSLHGSMVLGTTETCREGAAVSKPDCSGGSSCCIGTGSPVSDSSGGSGRVEYWCGGVSDTWETSSHSWVGLQSLPSGRGLGDVGFFLSLRGLSLPEVVKYDEPLAGQLLKVYSM